MDRRTFVQASAWLAVGSMLPAANKGCESSHQLKAIGLQLYSIRDAMNKDVAGTLQRVAAIGYDLVESASYNDGKMYGMTAKAFKDLLMSNGLKMPSSHVSADAMDKDGERAIATHKEAGAEFIVIPWWPEQERTAEGYARLVKILNRAGDLCQQYGVQLCYHNHDFEFDKRIKGVKPYDMLLSETDADKVQMELDLYWITRAGDSFKDYFEKAKGRYPLWHVKDMDNTPERFFAAVGNGTIDWNPIFDMEDAAGMQYFFVEQDNTRPGVDIMDQITMSHAYLDGFRY